MASLAVACVAYLLAVRECFVAPSLSRKVVVIGIVFAAMWNIAFLRLPAGADDDIHRYVWDGRLQRLGYNPYLVIPSDPAVRELHTPETRTLNNPDLPSPYPPGAQLFFRGVTAIRESTFAFKIAFVACEFAIALVLFAMLRPNGREHLVLIYAWNPLLAIEVAGSGHIDIVGALLLVISAAALVRHWRTVAAVAFGLSVAVKFLPIVLLPVYWKRIRIRDAVLAAAVVVTLYVPFINHSRIPTGSLGTYVRTFRFNGPVFAVLDHVASASVAAVVAVIAGLVVAIWMKRRSGKCSPEAFAWPMAVSLLCAPAVFPWYLLWPLPFMTSASDWPIIVWTASIIPTYIMWHLRATGHGWGALPGWVMVVEYGCVAMAVASVAVKRIKQRSLTSAAHPFD